MQRLKNYAIASVIIALLVLTSTTSSQNQEYRPEISPLTTSRPAPQQSSLIPQTKFVKVQNPIPNRYIVVLNDDVVYRTATVAVRRAQVSTIADSFAQLHGGKVGFIYETALVGFATELPNEAAALAISRSPQVKYVEEDAMGSVVDTQFNPPWGLDRIDQESTSLNGQYVFNATGSGVTAY
ncbi:MAG: S8 family serine peptidase, partial [Acidobacteriota bacterium]|nr:S8 family serine peptidase [Acidobacteriota bacterium]